MTRESLEQSTNDNHKREKAKRETAKRETAKRERQIMNELDDCKVQAACDLLSHGRYVITAFTNRRSALAAWRRHTLLMHTSDQRRLTATRFSTHCVI